MGLFLGSILIIFYNVSQSQKFVTNFNDEMWLMFAMKHRLKDKNWLAQIFNQLGYKNMVSATSILCLKSQFAVNSFFTAIPLEPDMWFVKLIGKKVAAKFQIEISNSLNKLNLKMLNNLTKINSLPVQSTMFLQNVWSHLQPS